MCSESTQEGTESTSTPQELRSAHKLDPGYLKGLAATSTCETFEGVALLQVSAQGGLLQGQQAGDFLHGTTGTVSDSTADDIGPF